MDTSATIEKIAANSYGRLLAMLASQAADLTIAEDALAGAFHAALRQWPEVGIPAAPEAWIFTVAKRRILDELRRSQTRINAEAHLLVEAELHSPALECNSDAFTDKRLELLFVCAHPAIDPMARTPLMLQTVLGLDAARIASAFLVAPSTMGQRLVRAKAKIRAAGIPFRVPDSFEIPERIGFVLEAIYAAYGTSWETHLEAGESRLDLNAEAIHLAQILVKLQPAEPEAHGLLALMLYCEARKASRRDGAGEYVPLDQQDVKLWNSAMIEEAETHLHHAVTFHKLGRYQLEAAIQSAHTSRAVTGNFQGPEVLGLYHELLRIAPSIGSQVAYAAALLRGGDSMAALKQLSQLEAKDIDQYQPYWATLAHVLNCLGKKIEAQTAFQRAAGLANDPAVRRFLLKNI